MSRRETIDEALYQFVKDCGLDATGFDYSEINVILDRIERSSDE